MMTPAVKNTMALRHHLHRMLCKEPENIDLILRYKAAALWEFNTFCGGDSGTSPASSLHTAQFALDILSRPIWQKFANLMQRGNKVHSHLP